MPEIIKDPVLIEPLMPNDNEASLENLAFELISASSALNAKLQPQIMSAVGDLVRSMNCYYSNLIEGHNTHPIDIEKALNGSYEKDTHRRTLQLEAFAHISVQKMIDDTKFKVTDLDFILWVHKEFYLRLPEESLIVEDQASNIKIKIEPGILRDGNVIIAGHLAPVAESLEGFLSKFSNSYGSSQLSKIKKIIAVAASHHRLLWIHPFFDGNGRVTRLFSHAFLKEIGIGSSLWFIARGLARNVGEYRQLLADADQWRLGDWDGRGNLSQKNLVKFCEFFLRTCIDQVKFMESLLEPEHLLKRIEVFCRNEAEQGKLHKGSYIVLREVILSGSLARNKVKNITGYQDRQARMIISQLIKRGLLKSDSNKGDLKLQIPFEVVEHWFPRLYVV